MRLVRLVVFSMLLVLIIYIIYSKKRCAKRSQVWPGVCFLLSVCVRLLDCQAWKRNVKGGRRIEREKILNKCNKEKEGK